MSSSWYAGQVSTCAAVVHAPLQGSHRLAHLNNIRLDLAGCGMVAVLFGGFLVQQAAGYGGTGSKDLH